MTFVTGSGFSSIWSKETAIEVNFRPQENRNIANDLQAEHQIGAVMRSREYRPAENALGHLRTGASAQPLPHNPRKQRKNPAAAGSGETFLKGKWRTDSPPICNFTTFKLLILNYS